MKDLHSHLLYGIDDGCTSIEESIDLLKKMRKSGITEVVVTPHYIEGSKYNSNNKDKKELLTNLNQKIQEENIDIKLYLGNEVFYTENFIKLLKNDEIATINGSRYILFEFPMNNSFSGSSAIVSQLMSKGYIPILAHPERYRIFQHHPEMVEEYLRMGVLLQGNSTSLFGKYGKTTKKVLKYFIKKGWISFLGTDTHHEVKYNTKKLERMLRRINRNKDYIFDILEGNFDKVVNNEEIGMIR